MMVRYFAAALLIAVVGAMIPYVQADAASGSGHAHAHAHSIHATEANAHQHRAMTRSMVPMMMGGMGLMGNMGDMGNMADGMMGQNCATLSPGDCSWFRHALSRGGGKPAAMMN